MPRSRDLSASTYRAGRSQARISQPVDPQRFLRGCVLGRGVQRLSNILTSTHCRLSPSGRTQVPNEHRDECPKDVRPGARKRSADHGGAGDVHRRVVGSCRAAWGISGPSFRLVVGGPGRWLSHRVLGRPGSDPHFQRGAIAVSEWWQLVISVIGGLVLVWADSCSVALA
jgi:hypothetical protein